MQQSVRKKMSITKLTMARLSYIREHYFQYISGYMTKRRDISNFTNMNKDTIVVEVGIEVLFNAICKAVEVPPEEADKLAIEEYSKQKVKPDKFVERLADFVELEYQAEQFSNVTPEERKKAVEEYRSKRNVEISSEWDEHS